MTVVTAVVPLRDGTSGKTRLSQALGPVSRRRLVATLARHVVATVLDSDAVQRVLVVTADVPFARSALLGLGPGVELVSQPVDRRGLNAAVDLGRDLAASQPGRLLVVHADLPALTRDDVVAVLAPEAPVVLAPDRLGVGTNALVLTPAGRDFVFRFGPGSLAAHRAEAAVRGLDHVLVERSGVATDLDTLADWVELPVAVRRRVELDVPEMGGRGRQGPEGFSGQPRH